MFVSLRGHLSKCERDLKVAIGRKIKENDCVVVCKPGNQHLLVKTDLFIRCAFFCNNFSGLGGEKMYLGFRFVLNSALKGVRLVGLECLLLTVDLLYFRALSELA